MFSSLQTQLKRASRLLPVALLPVLAHAQTFNYTPTNAQNVAGTYTDLGTTGAAIATANTDDDNSAAQNIGFTFNYNGAAFTQFVLNTNGFIRLGAAAPSAAALFLQESTTPTIPDPISSTNPANVNIIAPFNMDLAAGTAAGGTEYRVATTGTAPNRVCTIQWKNVSDKTALYDLQYSSISFQVKLYETTNNVEFVYNTATQGPNADDYRFAVVGLKGSSSANGQTVLVNKTGPGTTLWSAATFITGFYTNATGAFNYSGNVRPDAGRTYRFTPTVVYANDLSVQTIYTLGTVSSYASPVVVSAVIKNVGSAASTARNATLTVSGATTYTTTQAIPAIAANASTTITFTAYPVTAATGTNTVTVAVPADDAAGNNTASTQQTLSAGTLSYTNPAVTTFAGGFGSNSTTVNTATFYSKYTTNAASSSVSAVTPTFIGTATASNNYQVLILSAASNGNPGTVLYTSPARVRPLAGGDDVVSIPNIAVSGTFFVAVRQLSTSNFGLAYQDETPLRVGTFFASNDGIAFTDLSVAGTSFRPALSVTLSTLSGTRNDALAATMNLYPNPAHQSFQLTVPAGLHAATATLSNALGQVVLTRQLSLPTAGGTTEFNVSSFAPGIYTLTLKTGNDLVVKRVVVE
ncbi:T9SS type A sorting domain-containing protein [Hymenobacter monticola]|uniref:T9SS type A sorting domain-containing protein n=1 Tax=Hymenobacter monticola TaxID=1705399 RepID=A0ABY4BD62_9BACT|nr:T9SS type A sorting domain-containing protein [Hymenobacter monticola]UOE35728.1 T9SS type A sorting domain-containing protein [Hymenobacter monticola]